MRLSVVANSLPLVIVDDQWQGIGAIQQGLRNRAAGGYIANKDGGYIAAKGNDDLRLSIGLNWPCIKGYYGTNDRDEDGCNLGELGVKD